MAVTIIAYYIYKNGKLNNQTKSEIRKYLILAQLNRIYGGQPDQVVTKIRECIKENNFEFSLHKINDKMDSDKKFTISDDRLEEILSESKGTYTFMVLSLLYPHLKLNQIEFHQDHIHPSASFEYSQMKELGLIENKNGQPSWSDVYYKKDKLPNLQLLEGRENESKNSTPFIDWFENNVSNPKHYKEEHYIPTDILLSFEMFNTFYDKRKALLKAKLQDILKL